MNDTLAYLSLKHAKGLGARKIKLLVEALGSAQNVLEADAQALTSIEGFGPSIVKAIAQAKQSDWPAKELDRAQKLGLTLLHLEHPDYPDCLQAIYDPPAILYVKGELPSFIGTAPRSIGIVGTRNASDQAIKFTHDLAETLAAADITIVSGLALGIDTAAHKGSLKTGKTVAVLGSGIDYIYPAQNRKLAQTIASGKGAVISEYPLGSRPIATNFPGRNRIITGLSRAIVVVEAGQKSGALITADYAAQEGRVVFAVPGRPGDPKAQGSLTLLKQGALLLDSPQDIFDEFNWLASTAQKPLPTMTTQESNVAKAIQSLGTPLLDTLAEHLKTPAVTLLPSLTMLELKGVIKLSAGGRYSCLVSL